jgi:two-component system sensor histidine kinase/response regulator
VARCIQHPEFAMNSALPLIGPEGLQALIEKTTVWAFIIDTSGRFIYCSSACEQITGFCATELLADPNLFPSLIHPEDRDAYLAHLNECTNHPADTEFRLKHRDGSQRWIAHQCQPYFTANHDVVGRGGINRDITPRKLAEAENRKLTLAVEQSPVSIMITDLDGCIEYVNENLCNSSGYSRAELLGRNPSMLKSGLTPEATYRSLWTALKAEQPWQGELINRRRNGEIFFELERMTPIRQNGGKVTHFLAIKEDITERKHDAQELDQHRRHLEELVEARTQELNAARDVADEASRAKSEFLANMSHEIRTPMNGILGTAHMLRRRIDDPKVHRLLDTLETSGKHLLSIINDILDLSKVEAGMLELESTPIEIDSIVANVISMLSEQATAKHLYLVTDSEQMPHDLLGDPVRLQQALLNFAANAIKFTDMGSVTLRTRKQTVDTNTLLIRFEVIDTGIGIAPDAMKRLFQPFTQADSSTTRKHGGSGLGLSITSKLARLMGGEAGGNSKPGHGSTFWFTARLARSGLDARIPPSLDQTTDAENILRRDFSNSAILLVEDEPINQDIAKEFLLELGMRVSVASNGIQALEHFRNGQHALVLMDMQMPEMDGLEAAWRIRRLANGKSVPIIALTANVYEEDRQRCLDAGMNDILHKPYDPEDMARMLLKYLPASAIRT